MYSNKEITKYQDKAIRRFNTYLKENEKKIDSIKELTDNYYVITFKNKSVFKFKWDLPKEKIPAFRVGNYQEDNKIKKLF